MKILLLSSFIVVVSFCNAQEASLPVKILPGSDRSKPLIFYSSGDGGWTDFSVNFINKLNKAGYPVIALNARNYFWEKKTPTQTAVDAGNLIKQYLTAWKADSVVLIGYSFGADITPFIYTNLEKSTASKIRKAVLMLPGISTDFTVHISEMLGFSRTNDYSVASEVNKLSIPVLVVLGSEKSPFPIDRLAIKNEQTIVIRGGHHFDEEVDSVIKKITEFLK